MAGSTYDRFAPYYDAVYTAGPLDYAADVAFLQEAFRRFARTPVSRVIDLGAGTGNHAIPLAKAGLRVDALDVSAPLVERLREKAARAGVDVRAYVGDMAHDVPRGPFDAAVCMFGAWCYLRTDEASGRLLHQLHDRLAEGGLFVFEFWNPLGWNPAPRHESYALPDGGRLIRLTTPRMDLPDDVYRFSFEHIVLRDDRVVDQFVEEHALRLRTPFQTERLLQEHGFDVVTLTTGDVAKKTFDAARARDFRVMCIARRA